MRASAEVVVVPLCTERQAVFHLLLRYRFENAVALEASAEGGDCPEEVEPSQDLGDLATAVGLPYEIAVRDPGTLQEAPIPGEEDPLLGHRGRRQLVVRDVVSPDAVEAEKP